MFYSKESTRPADQATLSARARDASSAAAQNAQAAATAAQAAAISMGAAAQTAAQGMGNSMRQGVQAARVWAAPRLETAADYCTATAAPRVADALRSTARQVSIEDASDNRSTLRTALSVSVLAGAVLAAAGAVAVLVRRQYKSVQDPDAQDAAIDVEDPNEPAGRGPSAGGPPAPGAGSTPNGTSLVTDTGTGRGANGHGSSSGR